MMKKILYLFAAVLTVTGCKKKDELVFEEKPEVRIQKSIEEVDNLLISSPNGWVGTLTTSAGGGFGFYMTFDRENQNVTMYSDINSASSATAKTSTYRVKGNIGAELIFDTYNYISMLADPNPGTLGGTTGSGYSSDSEFLFDYEKGDTVAFIGKKYRQPFKLVKATAAEKAAYEAGNYKTSIEKLGAYFIANSFPYVEIGEGASAIKAGININIGNGLAGGKRIDFTGVVANDSVASSSTKYAYTLTGAGFLNDDIVFAGVHFVRLAWKDATTLAAYDNTGKEYIVKNSIQPLVPIGLIWGTKYVGLLSAFKTINPGTTQKGADILNYFHNNLNNASILGFAFNSGRITLTWDVVNKRLVFGGFSSQNGGASGWTTNIVYSYTVDNAGVYKFTKLSAASGGYVSNIMIPLDNFLLNNNVVFDYYISNGMLYASMASVQDPSIVMTFSLF